MAISRALRRLLSVREAEEEQARTAQDMAASELRRLELAQAALGEREHRGRGMVAASVHSSDLQDRLAGLEEVHFAHRADAVLRPLVAAAEAEAAARREEFLTKRVERRQAETLIREAKIREELHDKRHTQQLLDDWYLTKESGHAQEPAAESRRQPDAKEAWDKIEMKQAHFRGSAFEFQFLIDL